MNKVLIVGDSFAADWSSKYQDYMGWPQLLERRCVVTNLAQAGCSEYRILKQILSVDLKKYDWIVVSHTSPSRVYTPRHPVHANDALHCNSDLIYSDAAYHANKLSNWFNRGIQSARDFFLYHYDEEYYEYVYDKIRQDINKALEGHNVITLNNFETLTSYNDTRTLDLVSLRQQHPGLINHFSAFGNWSICQMIWEIIEND